MLWHLLLTLAALTSARGLDTHKQARIAATANTNTVLEVDHLAGIVKHASSGFEKQARVEHDSNEHTVSGAEVVSGGGHESVAINSIAKNGDSGENHIHWERVLAGLVVVLAVTGVGYEIHRRKSESDVTDVASFLTRSSTLLTVAGDLAQEADEDRKTEGGEVSTNAAIVNLLTVMIGCGVLRFPQLVAECGWVLGGAVIVAAAVMNYLSCMALTRAIEHVSQKRPVSQYRDVVDAVFGPVGAVVTDVVFMSTLVSICAVYTTLLSDYSYALFGSFVLPRTGVSAPSTVPTRWTIGTGCVVALIALLKDISFLSKIAVLGAISGGFYVVAIVGGGITKAMSDENVTGVGRFYPESFWPRYFPKTGDLATEPWRQSLGVADSFVTAIKAFSVMLFGYCCSDSLTSFRSTMRKPEDLPAVLKLTHVLACMVYTTAGLAGFYGFGVEAKADILHSLCTHDDCVDNPEKRMIYYYILGGSVVMSVAVSLPFSFFVLFKALANKIALVRENAAADSAARIGVVAAVTTTCVLVPSFTRLMDVMCDGFINMVVMIIPAACCLQIRRTNREAMDLLGLTDIAIVILGFVNAGIGLSNSVPALFAD